MLILYVPLITCVAVVCEFVLSNFFISFLFVLFSHLVLFSNFVCVPSLEGERRKGCLDREDGEDLGGGVDQEKHNQNILYKNI